MSEQAQRRDPHQRAETRPGNSRPLGTAPGLARLAATAWWNTAGWTVETSVRAGSRAIRAAVAGDSAGRLLHEAGAGALRGARRVLWSAEENGDRTAEPATEPAPERPPGEGASPESLRERGAELLRRSADVRFEEESHPAYARILEVMAPDEARILRLLAERGPQPSIDVRRGIPVVASELVSPGLTMIGAEAGCRHPAGVHAYLNNLYRLGLIWFSREPVADRLRYQVLEAQPEVTEALRSAGRTGRTVRRSIHLTPFGEDFCEVCLPLDTSELEAAVGAESEPTASP